MELKKDLVECLGVLKQLPRTGWLQRSVPLSISETVASHLFEASIIAGLISGELAEKGYKINMERAMAMAVLHDIGECLIGDVTPLLNAKIGGRKEEAEKEVVAEILSKAPSLLRLYEEWATGGTVEAVIARISDRVSTIIQAQRYRKHGYTGVSEIIDSYKSEVERLIRDSGIHELYGIVETLIGMRGS